MIQFYSIIFILGISLSMDAFTVSIVNGLNEPLMKKGKGISIALCFALFQAIMPLLGYFIIRFFISTFTFIEPYIPWFAFIVLLLIGLKALYEAILKKGNADILDKLTIKDLIIQGIATSIDALSVGFTLIEYNIGYVFQAIIIIGFVTFLICIVGVFLGKKFGVRLGKYAEITGGIVLILVGLEILLTGIL